MKSRELNQMLLSAIPEIKSKLEDETNWQEGLDTGSFIVFEDVFLPYLESKVEVDDEYIKNVLYVAVLENFSNFENPDSYIKYFKPKSLKIYNDNYSKK